MENKKPNWSEQELAKIRKAQEKDKKDIEDGKGLPLNVYLKNLKDSLDAKYMEDAFGTPSKEQLKEMGKERIQKPFNPKEFEEVLASVQKSLNQYVDKLPDFDPAEKHEIKTDIQNGAFEEIAQILREHVKATPKNPGAYDLLQMVENGSAFMQGFEKYKAHVTEERVRSLEKGRNRQ
jgi:hypothetical protein